jgi:hypothetical protein
LVMKLAIYNFLSGNLCSWLEISLREPIAVAESQPTQMFI